MEQSDKKEYQGKRIMKHKNSTSFDVNKAIRGRVESPVKGREESPGGGKVIPQIHATKLL